MPFLDKTPFTLLLKKDKYNNNKNMILSKYFKILNIIQHLKIFRKNLLESF